jgi:predicted metalloprotease
MRWQGARQSQNVEDRRRMPGGPIAIGGGLGTLLLIAVVVLMGGDPRLLLQNIPNAPPQPIEQRDALNEPEDELRDFVSVVLADTEDVWRELFRERGDEYVEPKLVLFTGEAQSPCGFASAAMGPFYCSNDAKVYIDLAFYDELRSRFGAPGDFAQAYVIAHEIGHHVQNQLGILKKVNSAQRHMSPNEANRHAVRLELQADFFAGVWAHHAQRMRQVLEPGDLEEALRAATAIGDDRLQRQAQGYIIPDSFTHGTSDQRLRWFRRGFESGSLAGGDTFSVDYDEL